MFRSRAAPLQAVRTTPARAPDTSGETTPTARATTGDSLLRRFLAPLLRSRHINPDGVFRNSKQDRMLCAVKPTVPTVHHCTGFHRFDQRGFRSVGAPVVGNKPAVVGSPPHGSDGFGAHRRMRRSLKAGGTIFRAWVPSSPIFRGVIAHTAPSDGISRSSR